MGGRQSKQREHWRSSESALNTTNITDGNAATPIHTWNGTMFEAKCVHVYDGDTIHIVVAMHRPLDGKQTLRRLKCRLYGYNSAELRTNDSAEKEKAIAAKNALSRLILDRTIGVKCHGEDKYGRLLVECSIDGNDIREYMLARGHGVEYYGRGEKKY